MITIHGHALAENARLYIGNKNANDNLTFIENSGKCDQINTPKIYLKQLQLNFSTANFNLTTARTVLKQKKDALKQFQDSNGLLAKHVTKRAQYTKLKDEYEAAKENYKNALKAKKEALLKLTRFHKTIAYQRKAIELHKEFMEMTNQLLDDNNKYRPLFQYEKDDLKAEVDRHTNAYNNSIFSVDFNTGTPTEISNIGLAQRIKGHDKKDLIYPIVGAMYCDYSTARAKDELRQKLQKGIDKAKDIINSVRGQNDMQANTQER